MASCLEPKTVTVRLIGVVVKTEEDLDSYLADLRLRAMSELEQGQPGGAEVTVLEKSARTSWTRRQAARRAATAGADQMPAGARRGPEKKPAHLTPEQSELRRRLRVRCRGLGSWQDLVRAVAYEQWHRMLFARFLAENDLLIHPDIMRR